MILPGVPDVLAVVLILVVSVIAIRSAVFYRRIHTPLFFILGLSMALLALTALADLVSSHMPGLALNTDWFLYVGQATSFLFIFLSLLRSTDDDRLVDSYWRPLRRWQIIVSLAVLLLLALSPVLPAFPNIIVQAILSGARCVFCFLIFFRYLTFFMSKETRFSLLMTAAFLLLSFGYLVILMQYAVTMAGLFDNLGDLLRIGGLILLLFAFRE